MEEVDVAMDMSMSEAAPKEMLRQEINFEKIFKLDEEQRNFYLDFISKRVNNFNEEINNYLSRYGGNPFKIDNEEIRTYMVKLLSEMTGWGTETLVKKSMETEGLIIDHREAIIDEVLD